MLAPELLLDVGFHGRDGRAIQEVLLRVRPQLHRLGIGVVGHDALVGLPASAGWRCRPDVDPRAGGSFGRQVRVLVRRESAVLLRAGRRPRTIIISSPHLLGARPLEPRGGVSLAPYAGSAIEQILHAVNPRRVGVALHVRRQDRLIEDHELLARQRGDPRPLDGRFPDRDAPVLDLVDLVERLEAIPRVDVVHLRPLEPVVGDSAAYVGDLLAVLGVSERVDLAVPRQERVPEPTYSARAATIARAVDPCLDSDDERRLVRSFLLEHFPQPAGDDPDVFSRQERGRILAANAARNRRLFERWMPDLPPDAYVSDEATSRMVEGGEGASTNPDDTAVEVAALRDAWNRARP